MTSEQGLAAWWVGLGTARGNAHEARHLPNQDNVETRTVAGGAGVVVAVADGHGASRHFRSAAGSLLAVRAACAVTGELTAEAGEPWDIGRADALRDVLPQAVVTRWRELVAGHLAAHPYTAEEQAGLAATGDSPVIPYGSTLIVALIAGDWLVCAQIGDGDLVAIRPDGEAWAPVSGDAHLDGYHTTSLCQAGAVGSFRAAAYDLRTEPLLALLLSTDGYGNAQAADPWQPAFARDLAGLAAQHDHGWFEQQLPVWAERCASAEGSGDDTTIALLLAPDSARLAAAALVAPRPDAVTTLPVSPLAAGPLAAGPIAAGAVPAAPSPWAPQSPAARRRIAEAAHPAVTDPPPHRSSASPPTAAPPGQAAPRSPRPPRDRASRRRAAVAGIIVVVAAVAVAVTLLVSRSSGPGPSPRPSSRPVPAASPTVTGAGTAPVQRDSAATPVSGPASTSPAGKPSTGKAGVTNGASASTPAVRPSQNREG